MKRILLLLALALPATAAADEIRTAADTGVCMSVFVADNDATDGSGKTGLSYNSGSMTCYYFRNETATGETATTCNLATSTLGTHPGASSTGFKEISSANMPGWYEFCPLDAAFATGAKSVSFQLKGGAADMAQTNVRVLLFSAATDANVIQISGDSVAADNVEAAFDGTATTELSGCPTGTTDLVSMIKYLYQLGRNKFTATATTGTLFKDDGSTSLCTFTTSDSAGTFTNGEGS